jgi:short-subunit dehydrogenase
MATITPTVHKGPYAAIDPTHAQLSQAGRTIVITGGSKGIGFAIARSFAQAGACHIIIVARSRATLDTCTARIRTDVPGFRGNVTPMQCDLGDVASVEAMWTHLKEEGIVVDVLVLNAAKTQEESSMLNLGWEKTWELFETNVRGNLMMVERFMSKSTSPRKVGYC